MNLKIVISTNTKNNLNLSIDAKEILEKKRKKYKGGKNCF